MSDYRYLQEQDIPSFLAALRALGNRVLVPTLQKGTKESVVFTPWQEGDPVLVAKATVPAKAAVLPSCETLVTYKKTKNPDNYAETSLTLTETVEAEPTVVFASRPCDAKGIAILDNPYTKGIYKDPYYMAKREKLVVISLTCNSGCETCFCHWVGGGPSSPEGSDILMTEIPAEGTKAYVLQPITAKGKEMLAKSALKDGESVVALMNEARKAAFATLSPKPDLTEAPQKVAACFANLSFWAQETERCISCGACTYFCPTCYCFTITDEGEPTSAQGGRRLRSWDTCMSSLFTREASGHNPRPSKAERMRNRVSHKFATYPENWGIFSCSGCGRCISQCPVGLDIRKIVLHAIAEAGGTVHPPKQEEAKPAKAAPVQAPKLEEVKPAKAAPAPKEDRAEAKAEGKQTPSANDTEPARSPAPRRTAKKRGFIKTSLKKSGTRRR